MGRELRRFKQRKKIRRQIEKLIDKSEIALVIHYSCESFHDRPEGKSPRITSIAIRSLDSGQTYSFSIHKIAEQQGVSFEEIENKYDELEKEMLQEFFSFVNSHQPFYWIHWNMRDINYGFTALAHRYKVLNGNPITIVEDKKFDLARALVDLYGLGYIGHPRMQKLIAKNKITNLDFLSGAEEAEAFINKEYVKLHLSTLRKVDIIANILKRTHDHKIQTNIQWWHKILITPKIIIEVVSDHWIWALIVMVGTILTIISFITK